jgi:hypothetical protein
MIFLYPEAIIYFEHDAIRRDMIDFTISWLALAASHLIK